MRSTRSSSRSRGGKQKANPPAETPAQPAPPASAQTEKLEQQQQHPPTPTKTMQAPLIVVAEAAAPSPQDDAGVAGNESLSDSEVMEMMAPHDAVEEEKRLRQEREEQEKATMQAPSLLAPTLETGRFAALEQVLRQSEIYTKFLIEQMKEIEDKIVQEARQNAAARESLNEAAAPDAGKGGKKRGRGKAAAAAASKEQEGPDAKKTKSSLTPTQELLPLLKADLRDYQLKGVKWLISLYQNGINGILADQMGLGKTVQTIGFLSHLKHKGMNGPFLIIGPLSTLPNWVSEFERFLPCMPALLYHGTKAEREHLRNTRLVHGGNSSKGAYPDDFPAIITSYEICIADIKHLAKMHFKYVVVDEGHRLKNFDCRLLRELKTLPADNKLLLTGTPLQNNLSELWSLLNFLMPDVFSNMKDFEDWFDFSSIVGQDQAQAEILAREQRNNVISKLHAILKPFVLRRLKSDVEIFIPRKQEMVLYVGMTELQKKLNKQLLEGNLKEEMEILAREEGGSTSSSGKLKNVLMQARKICNHPDLITSAFTRDANYPAPEVLVQQCGKMQLLDKLLTKLHANNHKVLIFSQMTQMLDIIESYLDQQGHPVCRIDGSRQWQERQANIKRFNSEPEAWVFLLSTRAGGLGINLTAADSVIIYDSDWNPHQDLQAMDRCHRIGQLKPVLVFRLATGNSVEGKMLKRASDKMALERLVIKKGAFKEVKEDAPTTSLSAAELVELLKGDYSVSNDETQSGTVNEQMINRLLDRTHLTANKPPPYPPAGVGYEVVQVHEGSGMLQDINK